MKAAEQEQEAEQGQSTKTLSEFSKKFYELAKEVRGIKGLDIKEMQLIMNITLSLVKGASVDTIGPKLAQIQSIISKRVGEPK